LSLVQLLWKRFVGKDPIKFRIKGNLVVRSRWTGIKSEVEIDRVEVYEPDKK
jgi:hypothetical protein